MRCLLIGDRGADEEQTPGDDAKRFFFASSSSSSSSSDLQRPPLPPSSARRGARSNCQLPPSNFILRSVTTAAPYPRTIQSDGRTEAEQTEQTADSRQQTEQTTCSNIKQHRTPGSGMERHRDGAWERGAPSLLFARTESKNARTTWKLVSHPWIISVGSRVCLCLCLRGCSLDS